MLNEAHLGIGSNLGDRHANIAYAQASLGALSNRMVFSSVYETAPRGFSIQPSFLNAACAMWTHLDPFELLAAISEIESRAGRHRTFANAPRSLDIDILAYGQRVIRTPHLTIPHPRMSEREFVLVPLAEVAPALSHPVTGLTVRDMLKQIHQRTAPIKRIAASRNPNLFTP